jgi:hypothetical protein
MTATVRTARGFTLTAVGRRRVGFVYVDLHLGTRRVELMVRTYKAGDWKITPPSMLAAATRILGVDQDDVYAAVVAAIEAST